MKKNDGFKRKIFKLSLVLPIIAIHGVVLITAALLSKHNVWLIFVSGMKIRKGKKRRPKILRGFFLDDLMSVKRNVKFISVEHT